MPRVQLVSKPEPRRVRLKPELLYPWTGVFENWSKAWVKRQGWRVKQVWGSDEDALQQCAMTYAKCLSMYGETARGPSHFMALYQTAVTNHWHKFAVKDGRYREVHCEMPQANDSGAIELTTRPEYSAGPLAASLAGASEELRFVLGKIFSAPTEVLATLLPADGEDVEVADMDRQFRRWFCLPKGTAVASELKKLLTA